MGVLGAVMDAIEQSREHRTSLQQRPLRGHAGGYLRALSMEMTGRGETAIVEANARALASCVSAKLRAAEQVAEMPDPGEILDELSKRHVLVRAEDGEISFGSSISSSRNSSRRAGYVRAWSISSAGKTRTKIGSSSCLT